MTPIGIHHIVCGQGQFLWGAIATLLLLMVYNTEGHCQERQVVNGGDRYLVHSDIILPSFDLGGVADTTAAWRYYPLHVGNVWEHQRDNGFEIVDIRREIVKDTTISDTTYVIQEDAYFRNGSMTSFQRYVIRYDTSSATIMLRTTQDTEVVFFDTPCRFDTDFDVQIVCHPSLEHTVSGDTDGALEFNDGSTVEGVTIKSFTSEFYTISYAADFGMSQLIDFEGGGIESLQYAKVDGKEFGVAMLPTSNEPHELASQGTYIQLWPNPTFSEINIRIEGTNSETANIRLYSITGQHLMSINWHRAIAGSGTRLDLSDLPSGTYVLQVSGPDSQVLEVAIITRL